MILCGVVTQKAIIRETEKVRDSMRCSNPEGYNSGNGKKIRDSMRCSNPEGYNEGNVEENS